MSVGAQMRWWFVDRFSQRPSGSRTQVSGERFSAVMQRLDVSASVDIVDRIGGGPRMGVDIGFRRPRDFRVADVIEAVPVLAGLQKIADTLRRDPGASAEAAADKIEAYVGQGELSRTVRGESGTIGPADASTGDPAGASGAPPPDAQAPATPTAGTSIDDIFARAEAPKPDRMTEVRSGLDDLVGALLGPRIRVPDPESVDERKRASEQIADAVLLTALDVLGHPDVASLEASWRGLKFVLAQSPGHEHLSIELVDADPDDLLSALRLPTSERERPDAIFVGPQLSDPHELKALSDLAAQARIPVVVAVDEALPFAELQQDGTSSTSETWESLRAHPSAPWLCATMNPVALVHEETPLGPRLLGGSPAFVLAAMMAAAFDPRTGLQPIAGPGRALVAPAAHDVELMPGEHRTIPTAYFAPWALQETAARSGVVVLGSAAGSDRVVVADTPTIPAHDTSLVARIRQAHASRTGGL